MTTTPNSDPASVQVSNAGANPIVDENNPSQPSGNAPVVETVTPEPVDANAAPIPAADPAATPDADAPKSGTPEPWIQRRINELTGKRYEAERRAQESEDRLKTVEREKEELAAKFVAQAANPTVIPPTPPAAPVLSENEIERRAQEKAVAIAHANEFNKACNTVVETGKKEYKDWDDALKNLAMLGVVGEKANMEFLETAIEMKNPAQVLHHLGSNMDEAARISKLPPKRMALEMARVEASLNVPKAPAPLPPLSNAPAPVITIGGNGVKGPVDLNDPSTPMDVWAEERSRQITARRQRYLRA